MEWCCSSMFYLNINERICFIKIHFLTWRIVAPQKGRKKLKLFEWMKYLQEFCPNSDNSLRTKMIISIYKRIKFINRPFQSPTLQKSYQKFSLQTGHKKFIHRKIQCQPTHKISQESSDATTFSLTRTKTNKQ